MTPRVLVVDDADAIRALIKVNLELEGYDVRAAADGLQALEVLGEWRPDVITLDVVMPRLDGFETLERLRGDPVTAGIPVVVVTGRAQAADRGRGCGGGRGRLPHQAVRAGRPGLPRGSAGDIGVSGPPARRYP